MSRRQRRELLDLGRVGLDGRVGRGEHARVDLRGAATQGNVRDQRAAHAREILCRLRIPPGHARNRRDMVSRELMPAALPMGAICCSEARRRRDFLAWALRDPHAGCAATRADRQRLDRRRQSAGARFDVACSDGLNPDSEHASLRRTTARPSICAACAARARTRAQSSCARCGPIRRSTRGSARSTTSACWRIRRAAGRLGTPCAPASSRTRSSRRPSRNAPAARRSGTFRSAEDAGALPLKLLRAAGP